MTRPDHLHDAITGQHLTFLQSARQTDGELLQLEVRLDAGGWVPRHAHARQDELVKVLDGRLCVRVGRSERILEVGDSIQVPRRKLHILRNTGDGEARFLLDVRPARRMEGAMRILFCAMRPLSPLARLRRRT